MKGLIWTVELKGYNAYYKERGNTPQEALGNLAIAVQKGVDDTELNLGILKDKLDRLNDAKEMIEEGVK